MQTIVLITLIVVGGVAQYILMAQAIKDLLRRPRVRGDNKVTWGLIILCVPFAGALIYNWMGPTSFMRRSALHSHPLPVQSAATSTSTTPISAVHDATQFPRPTNVTPIRAARSLQSQRPATNGRASSFERNATRSGSTGRVDRAIAPPRRTGS